MIQVRWGIFISKAGFWLMAEVWLNLIGLDNLADYSEFLFDQSLNLYKNNYKTVKLSKLPPYFCEQINEICPIDYKIENKKYFKSDSFHQKCKQLQHPCLKVIFLTYSRLSR